MVGGGFVLVCLGVYDEVCCCYFANACVIIGGCYYLFCLVVIWCLLLFCL